MIKASSFSQYYNFYFYTMQGFSNFHNSYLHWIFRIFVLYVFLCPFVRLFVIYHAQNLEKSFPGFHGNSLPWWNPHEGRRRIRIAANYDTKDGIRISEGQIHFKRSLFKYNQLGSWNILGYMFLFCRLRSLPFGVIKK